MISTAIFLLGAAALFISERYFSAESYLLSLRISAMVIAAMGILYTLFLSMRAAKNGRTNEARSWRLCSLWQAGAYVALIVYLGYTVVLGDKLHPQSLMEKALLAAWLGGLILSLTAGAGMQWAHRECGTGSLAEPNRVKRAGSAWLAVGMLIIFLVGVNYAGAKRDVIRDWSYLKTTTPSESTRKMIATLAEKVEIALFYPQGNDVKTSVSQYFDSLAKANDKFTVSYYDKDMHPTRAETFKVSKNGQVVLSKGNKRARIDTGTEIDKKSTRKTLRSLDGEFQKKFLDVTAEKKTAYFTRGHGESSWVGASTSSPSKSIRNLEGVLRDQNYNLKLFGLVEGSATKVPDDASVVIILGPTRPFQKEEVEALRAYLDLGGSLMVFLDVEKGPQDTPGDDSERPLLELLAGIGLEYKMARVANDRNFISATKSPADHWFLVSNVFTSHDSVVSLARNEERLAVAVFQSGHIRATPELAKWRTFETVRTLSDSFVDLNKNTRFDSGSEKRDAYVLGAAAEKAADPSDGSSGAGAKSRVVLFSDATAVSDPLIGNTANILYFLDSLKWAVGESEFAGAIASEEDIQIQHKTGKRAAWWFHGTVVLVPLIVLGCGFVATRRRKVAPPEQEAAA